MLREAPNFYNWIMANDFPQNTKQVLTQIRMRESMLSMNASATPHKQ